MKFPSPVSIATIAEMINAETIGNTALQATGINEINRVEAGDLVFVDHPKYYEKCLKSNATHIIINTKNVELPEGKTLLIVAEPFEAYLKIINFFRPFKKPENALSDSFEAGEGTVIMPNVFIGEHVKIGKHCIIHPGVVLHDYTEIGDHVIIQAGTIIGSDAFYYNTKKNRDVWYKKMASCGNVVIEDDVEIGAGCTIDRGVTSTTRLRRGTKLDNLIHIGHDTIVGKNCLIAAQVVIAGAVTIEDGVVIWGQAAVNKTLTIGENAVILGKTGVVASIAGNKVYWGTPAVEASAKKRELVWIKRIPELWNKVMGE
ncbi:MAG: UDP-3-O-(3-hydroxymyristoyl)glucosamine N-acyltransferase [Chitinophagaceae bacterium]|nr:UDP-3-O-(3-hydroxymyristoyl)glucosamine N-acyltransferase [Chitinophagaceae bacterium]